MPNGYISPRGRKRLGPKCASNRNLMPRDLNDYELIDDLTRFENRIRQNNCNKQKRPKKIFKTENLTAYVPGSIPARTQEKLWNLFRNGGTVKLAVNRGYKMDQAIEMWHFYQRKNSKFQ